jgi:uncharacterized membrane protein YdjX (TVP38/TMEM64 family)
MGLDSECDLAIEARGDPAAARAIAGVRDDLLAEHLGVPAARVADALRAHASLAAAVDALRGGPRTLEPIEVALDPLLDELVPDAAVLDPERPVGPDELMERLLPELGPPESRPLARVLGLAVAVLALGALWRFTPLSEWATPERLAALAAPLRVEPLGPPLFAAAIVLASLLLIPLGALAVGSVLVFGPLVGFATAFAGALGSAALGFAIGRLLWGDLVRRMVGRRLRRLRVQFARRGLLAVAALRVVPVAPFTVVNVVAGASPLSFREYLLGSALALGPLLLGLALLAHRARIALLEPGYWTFAVLTALLAGAWLLLAWARRRVARHGGL